MKRHNLIMQFYAIILVATFGVTNFTPAQGGGFSRGRAKDMLNAVKSEIKDNYYDSAFHGLNLDERFKLAEQKLDTAESQGQMFGIIAQAVMDLNDSHTIFVPPSRAVSYEYGWRMQMIGDKCVVVAVKPKSDAEAKGLKIGDEVIKIEGFKPSRKEFWKMGYYYNLLSPRNGLNAIVKSPDSETHRELNIAAKAKRSAALLQIEDLIRDYENSGGGITHRFVRLGKTTVWKMPSFAIDPDSIDGIVNDRIKRSLNLVLDLRGNGGGYVVTLERLAGYFVDKDTKIADLKGRKEKMKPQLAKSKGSGVFNGKVIILLDANSGSASEIFARFIQLQGRGIVIGDQSAGAVMQSRRFSLKMGTDSIILYGMNITNADVIMSDGQSLEHIGVTPNLLKIPTPADVAANRDPVLATALALLGQEISSEEAGKLFPYEWEDR